MNVAQLIVKYLEKLAIDKVFYIPGGALVPITQAFWNSSKIDFVYNSHECGAAFMAHGYAVTKNTLGVCCLTTGPGATNAITAVATAKLESVPMLVITAMNSLGNFSRKPFQDSTPDGMNTTAVYEKFTHYSRTIYHPNEAPLVLQQAIRTAFLKKGPVHVSIPTDVGKMILENDFVVPELTSFLPKVNQSAPEEEIARAAEALLAAENPVIFAGYGTNISQAHSELLELAETLSIPVISTMKAKGCFPEDHLLSLGVYGLAGTLHSSEYLREKHDTLLSVGAGFHEMATNNWTDALEPSKHHIQIEANPLNYGVNYPGTISLIGDAKKALRALNLKIKSSELPTQQIQKREEKIQAFKGVHFRFENPERMLSDSTPLKPQRLMNDIQESFPEETIFVADSGSSFLWSTHLLTLKKPGKYLVSTNSAPMGFSVVAMGCKSAAPETPVVAIIGDGAMKMQGMEIATAVNNDLPVIFIVLNDSQWGMIKFGDELLGLDIDVSRYEQMDCAKIAEGLGARGIKITDPGQINAEFVQELLDSKQTVVLDVYIDASECPPLQERIRSIREQLEKKSKKVSVRHQEEV